MNKKQKIALIIFAVVDVVVVAVLAGTILTTWSSYPATMVQSSQLSCANYYLDALQIDDRKVTIAVNNDFITISVSIAAIENLEDAEMLWSLIDEIGQIAPNAREICMDPQSLTIRFNVSRENATYHHISILSFGELIQWSQGNLSEESFAANIKYRQITVTPD